MGDSDEDVKQTASIPSWQQAASTPAEDSSSQPATRESIVEKARKFLEDKEVKESTREKKIEFLRSKGLEEVEINELLGQDNHSVISQPTPTPTPEPEPEPQEQQPDSLISAPYPPENKVEYPPIVTYPEFLTKPAKPPPLITASGLCSSLSVVAGLSTFVYGATKYIVSPMVDKLTEARVDFHQNANKNLSQLVEKLEHTVSEIPASYHTSSKGRPTESDKDEDDSNYDDPTELFHRDIGVQTSPPASPVVPPPRTSLSYKPTPTETIQHQADRLSRMSVSIRTLTTDMISQAEDLAETNNVLDKFTGDLHALTYPPEAFGMGNNYLYGTTRNEPDDEIKRAKMNIRSVKGVLLSTRSFPATTR